MKKFFDINDREALQGLLLSINPNQQPLWGKMKPQQMVEHLIEEVKWTNSKKSVTDNGRTAEQMAASKQRGIYSDAELPKNVYVDDLPTQCEYPDIATAVNGLMKELDDFDAWFKQPGVTTVHGFMGPLTHDQWVIWHGKHFFHHLKQFGLIA